MASKFAQLQQQIDENTKNPAPIVKKTYTQSASDISPATGGRDDRKNSKDHGFKGKHQAGRGRAKDRHESGTGVKAGASKRGGTGKFNEGSTTSDYLALAEQDSVAELNDQEQNQDESSETPSGEESQEPEAPPSRVLADFEAELNEHDASSTNNIRQRRQLKGVSTPMAKADVGPIKIGASSSKKQRKHKTKAKQTVAVDLNYSNTSSKRSESQNTKPAYNKRGAGGRNAGGRKFNNRRDDNPRS